MTSLLNGPLNGLVICGDDKQRPIAGTLTECNVVRALGKLVDLVSIRDVVKAAVSNMELEPGLPRDSYIARDNPAGRTQQAQMAALPALAAAMTISSASTSPGRSQHGVACCSCGDRRRSGS